MQLTASPTKADPVGRTRLHTAFQQVVSLESGDVLGCEALMRADVGGRSLEPLDVLGAAQSRGELAEVDLASLAAAVAAAGAQGVGVLLVNIEPSTLVGSLARVLEILESRAAGLHIVVEVTERAIAASPACLLKATEALHAKGFPIALDDVGTSPQSLALLEIIRPRIVKLDMALLRDYTDLAALHVAGAVSGYAEAFGAFVAAVGIESQADLARAKTLGAHLGQGSLWGLPGEFWPPQASESPLRYPTPPTARPRRPEHTPFSLVTKHRGTRVGDADMVAALAAAVESSVTGSHLPSIVLGSVLSLEEAPDGMVERFSRLAESLPLVGLLGRGVTGSGVIGSGAVNGSGADAVATAVHLTEPSPADPLSLEWNVVALGAQSAVALTARELPRQQGQAKTFAFAITRERAVVVAAAAALISRLEPRPGC